MEAHCSLLQKEPYRRSDLYDCYVHTSTLAWSCVQFKEDSRGNELFTFVVRETKGDLLLINTWPRYATTASSQEANHSHGTKFLTIEMRTDSLSSRNEMLGTTGNQKSQSGHRYTKASRLLMATSTSPCGLSPSLSWRHVARVNSRFDSQTECYPIWIFDDCSANDTISSSQYADRTRTVN